MEPIELHTRDGGYVTTVQVPTFSPPPDVIVWGQRMFMRGEDGKYREAFTYVVPLEQF